MPGEGERAAFGLHPGMHPLGSARFKLTSGMHPRVRPAAQSRRRETRKYPDLFGGFRSGVHGVRVTIPLDERRKLVHVRLEMAPVVQPAAR